MISVNDEVKLNGTVTETGTGTLKIKLENLLLDGEWKQFVNDTTLDINVDTDINDHFTSTELKYIKKIAEEDVDDTTKCVDELEVIKSIIKKLGGATA